MKQHEVTGTAGRQGSMHKGPTTNPYLHKARPSPVEAVSALLQHRAKGSS